MTYWWPTIGGVLVAALAVLIMALAFPGAPALVSQAIGGAAGIGGVAAGALYGVRTYEGRNR